MLSTDLFYSDSESVVSGKIIFKNDVKTLILFITSSNGKTTEQHIPLEFLANYDKFMFNAIFKPL